MPVVPADDRCSRRDRSIGRFQMTTEAVSVIEFVKGSRALPALFLPFRKDLSLTVILIT